jgi:hypothetical protein
MNAAHRSPLAGISWSLASLLALGGCEERRDSPGGQGGSGGGSFVPGDCASLGEVGSAPSCAELCAVTNKEHCNHVAGKPNCAALAPADVIDVCGVPVAAPVSGGKVLELARSANVKEFGGDGPPDLACYSAGGYPAPPGTPATVTLKGVAKIFSHGCESKKLDIEVYTVKRTGGADDGEPDKLVGNKVTTATECMTGGKAEEHEDCGTRYLCTFEYPGVPSETELVILTKGSLWAELYEYGVYVPNAEVKDGSFDKDVRALDASDYNLIAQTAMGKTITPGNGAVGGEVHDCDNIRLENAVVDVDVSRFALTYFTSNEDTPLPDVKAKVTSTLGLYAAMDIKPGPVVVAAAGVVDGKLVGAGFFRTRIFPDAVTSVTFRGLKPFQLPPE